MSALDPYAQPKDAGTQLEIDAATQVRQDTENARKAQALQLQQQQNAVTQQQTTADSQKAIQTASGEFAGGWALDPYSRGKSFDQLDPDVQSGILMKYPGHESEIPGLFNAAQRNVSGIPGLGVNLEPGQTATSDVNGVKVGLGKPASPISWEKPDEDLIKQHRAIGANPTNADGSPKTAGQMAAELTDYNQQHGILPKPLADFQDAVTQQYQKHPIYIEHEKMAQGLNNFLSNYQQAIQNPNLANNMAVIDGFLRTQNPGGIVRQQTMNMVTNGQALLQRLTPDFIANHFTEGQKLTSQFVKDAADVMKREAEAQNESFKGSVLKGFQQRLNRRGIPSDDLESPLDPILQKMNQGIQPAATTPPPVKAGDVRNGFRFKGGNPGDQSAWEPIK